MLLYATAGAAQEPVPVLTREQVVEELRAYARAAIDAVNSIMGVIATEFPDVPDDGPDAFDRAHNAARSAGEWLVVVGDELGLARTCISQEELEIAMSNLEIEEEDEFETSDIAVEEALDAVEEALSTLNDAISSPTSQNVVKRISQHIHE
jgi:hypothetical protein